MEFIKDSTKVINIGKCCIRMVLQLGISANAHWKYPKGQLHTTQNVQKKTKLI